MSKSKKQRKQTMIAALAHELLLGAYRPEEDESLEKWAKRISRSIGYTKHSGKTRLSADDIKTAAFIASQAMEKVKSGGWEYHDPRTNTSIQVPTKVTE